VREIRSRGSVRGAVRKGRPYRDWEPWGRKPLGRPGAGMGWPAIGTVSDSVYGAVVL
jgi:hypothetical protein